MKIRITTEREILDEDYWNWIVQLKASGIPINGTELKEKGKVNWSSDVGYSKATTSYEIVNP